MMEVLGEFLRLVVKINAFFFWTISIYSNIYVNVHHTCHAHNGNSGKIMMQEMMLLLISLVRSLPRNCLPLDFKTWHLNPIQRKHIFDCCIAFLLNWLIYLAFTNFIWQAWSLYYSGGNGSSLCLADYKTGAGGYRINESPSPRFKCCYWAFVI